MLEIVGIVGGISGFVAVIGLLVHLHNKHVVLMKQEVESVRQAMKLESVTEAARIIDALKRFHETELEVQKRSYEQEVTQREAAFKTVVAELEADKKTIEHALSQIKDPPRLPLLKRVGKDGPVFEYIKPGRGTPPKKL